MGKKKAGGYIFETCSSDHLPYHVHIKYKGKEIGRFNIEDQCLMDDGSKVTGKLKKALIQTGYYLDKKKLKKK